MSTFKELRDKARLEPRRFYAFRVMPSGKTVRLTPFGLKTFGVTALEWQRNRAKARGWRIIVKKVATSADQRRRDEIVAEARSALAFEKAIHYRQSRPFPVMAFERDDYPIWTDCSGSLTMLYRAAGFKDPNGRDYDGLGYTGTLRTASPLVLFSKLQPGDFIVYGRGTGTHVVMVMQGGDDPIVWSHGQENGPRLYRHSVQVAAHGSYFTCHGPRK